MPGLVLLNAGFIGSLQSDYQTTIQYVGGYSIGQANTSTTQTIVLTSLSGGIAFAPSINDLVVVSFVSAINSDRNITATGYTEVADLYADSSSDTNLYVGYKYLTSTDASVVITSDLGSTSQAAATSIHVWRNVSSSNPLDVASITATTTSSRIPNPASITPITNGVVVLAIGANAYGTAGAVGVFTSSTLSNFVSSFGSNTTNASIGMGSKVWGAEAYDPDAFIFAGGDSTSHTSAVVTMALRPA